MNGMLDNCIACGRPAATPGGGICLRCEIMALIDLSFDRLRAGIRGEIPVLGRRIEPSQPRGREAGSKQAKI